MAEAQTVSEIHAELVGFALDHYREAAIDLMGHLAEGGRVPGIEKVSPRTLRAFFADTNPQQWFGLAKADPKQAIRAVLEYADVEAEEAKPWQKYLTLLRQFLRR